jgi:opacity protein-like surface antigen
MRFGVAGAAPAAMAVAATMATRVEAQSDEAPTVPRPAFYIGAGAVYTFTTFGQQWIYNQGISTAYAGGVPVTSGTAAGPANPVFSNQSNFAPVAQLGYFRHFEGSNWLWGAKFSYSYLGTTSSMRSLSIPQPGTSSNPALGTFGGGSVVGSYNITINHQTTLMPMVGRSFEKSFFYIGAGPSLSQISSSLENVVGYATFCSNNTNVSGQPQSFYNNQWTFGASATAGATFFLTKSWFLDLNYVFSMPNASITYLTSPFNNPGNGGLAFTGTLIGAYSANLNTHSIGLTINRAF